MRLRKKRDWFLVDAEFKPVHLYRQRPGEACGHLVPVCGPAVLKVGEYRLCRFETARQAPACPVCREHCRHEAIYQELNRVEEAS